MRGKRVVVALAVVAGLVGTAACGSATPSPTEASGTAFPLTFSDAMGQVTIPAKPTRVAALDTSYADDVIALRAPLVAYTRYPGFGDALPPYLGADAKTYAANARAVGDLDEPKIEMLAAAKPDLIVSAKVRHAQLHARLSALAPTVFSETTGATWKDNIRLLGKALGKPELADQKIKAYEDKAHRIGAALKSAFGRNPTVSLVRFVAGEPTVRLYGSRSFPGTVLADVGLARPQGQPDSTSKISVDLSQEQVTTVDADYVFDATWSDPNGESEKVRDQFLANPLWRGLKGKIADVDDVTWISSCSLQGANAILDDLARTFGVTVN
ncbi:MAG: iron-siderophore ABC transporter substrate-binding protein [Kutzneria sp.]|nr:iron-siderophore ABC transporter substrate-binding protein [Kutzneria sp.]MBV9844102.1 iron-siderophore ABC transporter substrate-binding protein [Kutzneria sp.]